MRRCVPVLFLGLLVGCTTGNPTRLVAPEPELLDIGQRVPDAEAGQANPAIRRASFVDQLPVAEGPLSLSEAIAFGLHNSPRLQSALASIERARAHQDVAFAPFLPRVDLLNRYLATSSNLSPGAPGPTGGVLGSAVRPHSAVQSELQLQWMLFDFGRTGNRYKAAEMRQRIARYQADRARDTVAYEIAVAFFQGVEAKDLREIARESVRRAEAVLEDTRARRAGGVALKDDVLRSQVQLAEAKDSLVRIEESYLAALARLNNAMGRDAALPVTLAKEPEPPECKSTLEDCLRLAARRPEVGVARDRVAAARFGRNAAESEFLPRLSLRASLGQVNGSEVRTGLQEGIGLHLDMPLYLGGTRAAEVQIADADIASALADARSVLNEITLDVTLAHRAMQSARTRVELSRPEIERAEDTLRVVRDRFRNGNATPTDIVDAETSLTRAQQRLASARIEYLAALARLAYTTGENPVHYYAPDVLDRPAVPEASKRPDKPRREADE